MKRTGLRKDICNFIAPSFVFCEPSFYSFSWKFRYNQQIPIGKVQQSNSFAFGFDSLIGLLQKNRKKKKKKKKKKKMECLDMNVLPESCVAVILSLTSPADACKSSLVSSTFQSASESDSVWERFLPSDYGEIVSKASDNLEFSSKKELYLLLCNPVLVADGKMSFKLERSTGRISYILSARELSITWSNDPMYWVWKSIPESRFAEVAELKTVSWLEIHGKIRSKTLTPNTRYGAYLLLKITDRAFGLDLIPSEISLEVGNGAKFTNTAYLRSQDSKKQRMEDLFYGNRKQMLKSRVIEGEDRVLSEREDGWMEIELGEFFNGEGDKAVKMSLMEVKGHQLKGGLIVEGIELRPKS
ncbi:hypothetical protein QUC31_009412 [Theobroma cacao]